MDEPSLNAVDRALYFINLLSKYSLIDHTWPKLIIAAFYVFATIAMKDFIVQICDSALNFHEKGIYRDNYAKKYLTPIIS